MYVSVPVICPFGLVEETGSSSKESGGPELVWYLSIISHWMDNIFIFQF